MQLQGPCDVKWGPVFSTSRQASRRKDFVVLVPDEAFLTGLPEANIQPWHELQVCARTAGTALPSPSERSASFSFWLCTKRMLRMAQQERHQPTRMCCPLQPKVWDIKNKILWPDRRQEVQFHGSRSTPARLELFGNTALLESPLTDFAFTDAGDDGTAGFVKPE
jgi:hypothetical protein